MISGFVIAYVYHEKVSTPAGYFKFLQRRVARLVPLHWITLLLAILIWSVVAIMHLHVVHMPDFSPACIAQTAFLLHAIHTCGNGLYFNAPSWSISTEMVMYLSFPLIVFAASKSLNGLIAIGVGFALLVGALVLSDNGWTGQWIAIYPILRAVPSFWIGAALFFNRALCNRVPAPETLLCASSVVLVGAMAFGAPQILTILLVYAVAVCAVSADVQKKTSLLVNKLAPLGQLTYSIYMWHGIVVTMILNALGDKLLHLSGVGMMALGVACYVLIFAISYVSFFFLETPSRRFIDQLRFGWSK